MVEKKEEDTFPLFVFAFALFGGAGIGAFTGSYVVPDNHFATLVGALALPLGVLVGLGFAEGVDPIRALFHLVHILDEHTAMTDRGFSPTTTEIMILVGPVVLSVAGAFGLATLLKVSSLPLIMPMAGVAAVYGLCMAGLVAYLSAAD
ncbi:MAG: hypothetical protein R3E66_13790 [bacterium]